MRITDRAEWNREWGNTPHTLFDNNFKAAEAAGWRFRQDERGYNGNPPAFYAISPTGYRYRWNSRMRHGNSDPWQLWDKEPIEEITE